MSQRVSLILLLAVLSSNMQAQETDLVIDMASYTAAGLFTNPLLPHEHEPVEIMIRLSSAALRPQTPSVLIEIVGPDQSVVTRQELILTIHENTAEGSLTWVAGRNGLYQILAWIDPDNQIEEVSEANNTVQLILPVLKTGIVLHLPWQYEMPWIRWATCIGSANAAPQRVRLNERGIKGLH